MVAARFGGWREALGLLTGASAVSYGADSNVSLEGTQRQDLC